MQSPWDKFAKELSEAVTKVYPYAVSIGVGTITKDITPPKKLLRAAPERRYLDHVHVLVLDRPVPQNEWAGLTGSFNGPQDMQAVQQNLRRGVAIQAIGEFCRSRRLPFEYHFAPCAWVELGPAVIESIKRTALEAQQEPQPNRAARRQK